MTATDYQDVPGWLAVGKQVIETGRPGYSSVRIVAKHTATQVVLDNDVRYRRKHQNDTCWSRQGASTWDYGTSVHPIDGAKAQQIRIANQRRQWAGKVSEAYHEWRSGPTVESARALSDAGLAWARHVQEQEQEHQRQQRKV